MIKLKSRLQYYQAVIYVGALSLFWGGNNAFASSLDNLSKSASSVETMVKGPVGTAALLIGTIGGAVGSLMKGNIWLAFAILIIGVLLGFHIDNISTIFANKG
ncbi:MAG: hypothetical protein ABFQ95_06480 [Pseudomonadota bacterium]